MTRSVWLWVVMAMLVQVGASHAQGAISTPATLSAAEDFLIPLHASHRATLVGQRTAGSTGQPLIIMLPGGAGAAICTKWDSYPDGREFVGVGINPDVEVYPTQAEVAAGLWSGGKDPVLERGVAVLREKLRGR